MRIVAFLLLTILMIGCGNHPLSKTHEQRAFDIRKFFYALLTRDDTRQVCEEHINAIYHILNSKEALELVHLPKEVLNALPDALNQLKDQPTDTIEKELKKLDDSVFEKLRKDIDDAVQNLRFEAKALDAIDVPKLGKSWTKFFKSILTEYFPSLELKDKKRILAFTIMNLPNDASDTKQLLQMVYHAGPYFQKYMQSMVDYLPDDDGDSKRQELKNGLEDVKDKLPSLSAEEKQSCLAQLKKDGHEVEIGDSLGAASVGEAFKATYKPTGKTIVLKCQRPGILDIAKREKVFFEEAAERAQGKALKKSVRNIIDQVDEEFDYIIEAKYIEAGEEAYENDGWKIRTVRLFNEIPATKTYLAMEFVDGKTFKQMGANSRDLYAKRILWEKVTRKFLKQAFFFTGEKTIFHGDLHEGNIMVTGLDKLDSNASREDVQKAIDEDKIQVVLIDFGNATTIDQTKRRRLKNIFMAASKITYSPIGFLYAILPEGTEPDQDLVDFLATHVFTPENENADNQTVKVIGESMDKLLERDIAIEGFIMNFKRSAAMLVKTHGRLWNAFTEKVKAEEEAKADGVTDPDEIGSIVQNDHIPRIDKVFKEPFIDNLPDLFSDSSKASDYNAAETLRRVAAGKVSRTVYDALPRNLTQYFLYPKGHFDPKSKDCWKQADNSIETTWICDGQRWYQPETILDESAREEKSEKDLLKALDNAKNTWEKDNIVWQKFQSDTLKGSWPLAKYILTKGTDIVEYFRSPF